MNKVLQKCGFSSVEEVQKATKKYKTELSALEVLEGLKNMPKPKVLSGRSRAERDSCNLYSTLPFHPALNIQQVPPGTRCLGRSHVVDLDLTESF